jgi:DUF3054 family protein
MRLLAAALADLAGVAVFAAVGRSSHAEGLTLGGVVETAWPFWAGWAAGALVGRFWRRPSGLVTGVAAWVGTVAGGMLLRTLTGAGVQLSFVVVASVVLAVLLLGWRGVARAVERRRQRPEVLTAESGAGR